MADNNMDSLNDIVLKVMETSDKLEFLGTKSKAKDINKQELRALKKLRDYLNSCGLDAFKL